MNLGVFNMFGENGDENFETVTAGTVVFLNKENTFL
jgi:hypothetical protein